MNEAHHKYIVAETAISVIINTALSGLFCWAVFHGRDVVTASGPAGYLIDTLPQTFMISLMSVLVPGLLTRQRLRTGRITPVRAGWPALPRRMVFRAPLTAVAGVALAGLGVLAIGQLFVAPDLPFAVLMGIKLVYGAAVAAIITPVGLRAALSETPVST